MPWFTRFRLLSVFFLIAAALAAGAIKFGRETKASKLAPLAPSVTSTMSAALVNTGCPGASTTDLTCNGLVNPGDTLRYTATIANGAVPGAGNDALNTVFTDQLPATLTLVAGSVKASPIAAPDAFAVTGNVRIQPAAGALISNDFNPITNSNATISVTTLAGDNTAPFSGTSAQGGTVTAADGLGGFTYNPPAGYEGTDTFTYTITDSSSGMTDTSTVTLTVTGMIWFVDQSAAAGGDGRLTTPFNCLGGAGCFNAVNDGVGDHPAANDSIFLYRSAGAPAAFTNGVTLLNGQKLLGEGATASLATMAGITLAPNSDALPTTAHAAPVLTTGSLTDNVRLTNGSTANTLRGFTIGDSGTAATGDSSDISGTNFGTLTISEVTLNGSGRTMNLTTGTLNATFISVSTNKATGQGMTLSGIAGTSNFGSTIISGHAIQCVSVQNTTANINFGDTTCTGGGEGINLNGNPSGTRTFGVLSVTGGTGNGFIHSNNGAVGGGSVTVTGTANVSCAGNPFSFSSPAAGDAINFQGSTTATSTGLNTLGFVWSGIAASAATFSSLSIVTNGTGTALSATGGGTLNVTNAAGTINNTTQPGPAIDAANVTLNVNFAAVKSSGGASGVKLTNVAGTSNFGAATISGSATQGIVSSSSSIAATFGTTSVSSSTTQGILIGTSTGNWNFGATTITGGTDGISFQNNSGANTKTFASLDVSGGSGNAFLHGAGGGNVTVTGNATLTSPASAISVNAPSGTNAISFGATTATSTTAGATAVNWVGTAGSSMTFNSLSIARNNATALNATTGGTITVTNNTGSITNTTPAGPAITAANVTLNAKFASINSTGGTNLVSLNTVAGTSDFGGGALTGTAGGSDVVQIQNGSLSLNYAGTITNNGGGKAVLVQSETGSGTFNFSGLITDASATHGQGILMTSNSAGTTVNFSGGMNISTTSSSAFAATGGGTVSATQNNTTIVNTLVSTTGTALNVANTNIGASGLTFRSITSNGAAKGIILNATASVGGLTVSGNGGLCDATHAVIGADCTGGTIQGGATRGIEVTNAAKVTLNNMQFLNTAQTSAGAAACKTAFAVGTTGCSAALYFNGVTDANAGSHVVLDRIFVNGTKQMGIAGTGINGMTLTNTEVENTTAAANEAAVTLINNTGTLGIAGLNLHNNDNGGTGMLFVENGAGTMTLNVTSSTFNKGTVNSGGINAAAYNSANMTVNIQSSTFGDPAAGSGLFSNGVTAAGNDTSTFVITINASSFINTNGISVSGNGSSATINITNNNPVQNRVNGSNGITFGKPGNSGTVTSTVTGNVITKADCGNCAGMRFNGFGPGGVSNATITGNTISTVNEGILVAIGQGSTSNNVVIQGNTISGPVGTLTGFAIDATNGTQAGDNPCTLLTIGGAGALANSISGVWFSQAQGAPTAAGWSMNFDNEKGTLKMPGYAGGNTVPAYMSGRNPSVTAVQILDQSVIPIVGGVNNCPAPGAPELGDLVNITFDDLPASSLGTPAGIDAAEPVRNVFGQMASVEITTPSTDSAAPSALGEMASVEFTMPSADSATASASRATASATSAMESALGATASAESEIRPAEPANGPSTLAMLTEISKRVASEVSPTVYSQGIVYAPENAELVTVNGGGTGFTVPAGKTVTIIFDAKVQPVGTIPANTFSVSNQGSTSGTGFGPILSDSDPVAAGPQPTVTTMVEPETITKAFNPTAPFNGQQSTLTFTIKNQNPGTAANGITFTDVFPTSPGAMVVGSPLTTTNTCGGTLRNNADTANLAAGDPGIKLVGGILAASPGQPGVVSTCTITVKVSMSAAGTYNNTSLPISSTEGAVGLASNQATVTVSTLTSAGVSVSGRVTYGEGRGIRGATVTLTNTAGESRSVLTGPRGTYQFTDVPTGDSYTISVSSRRFNFIPRVITVTDELTDLDFVGELGH